MTTGHNIGGHPSKNLEVFSSDNPVSPVHGQSLVTPDGKRTGINLLLFFRRQTRSLGGRSQELFNGG